MNKYDYGIINLNISKYDIKDKDYNLNMEVQQMLNKSITMFDYKKLPETIPVEEIEKQLQVNGYTIIYSYQNNIYCSSGALGGKPDIYNNPTEVTISNSVIGSKTFKLNEECILIKNDYLNQGLLNIYKKYCKLLIENDITMYQMNINKRINNIITASDDSTRESAELYIKKLEEGTQGIIMDNKLYDSLQIISNPNNTSMIDLVQYHQYLKASLYNEIGLNSNYNMKKERLISGEVEQNSDILYPFVDGMLECREIGVKKVNELFNTNIVVELDSAWNRKATGIKDSDSELDSDLDSELDSDLDLVEKVADDKTTDNNSNN